MDGGRGTGCWCPAADKRKGRSGFSGGTLERGGRSLRRELGRKFPVAAPEGDRWHGGCDDGALTSAGQADGGELGDGAEIGRAEIHAEEDELGWGGGDLVQDLDGLKRRDIEPQKGNWRNERPDAQASARAVLPGTVIAEG